MALYDAFVSYSHAKDKPVAAALQSVIQRLGKPWYRRRALRVFRDDTSLSATPGLWPSIERALSQSRFLILLASPEAAASPWVNKEISYWLNHRSADTLLIAVTDGELSWDNSLDDFVWREGMPLPPVLTGRFAAEPKWIDLRARGESTDPRDIRFLEAGADFAAAIHGIPKEDLLSQEVRQQRRALTLAWSAAGTLAVLIALAGWQWWEAEGAKATAQTERDHAQRNFGIAKNAADHVVFRIAEDLRHVQGMRVESVHRILDTARSMMDELARAAPNDLSLERSRAAMLNAFAQTYYVAGDLTRARVAAEESLTIAHKLAATDPNNAERQGDVGISLENLGLVRSATGDRAGALAAQEESLAIRRRLAAADSGDDRWQSYISRSLDKVGELRRVAGDRAGALAAYQESLAIRRKLAGADPGNADWQRDLSVSLNSVGDMRLAVGDRIGALAEYEESLTVARKLAAADPGNAEWQGVMSMSLNRLGNARLAAGAPAGARTAYEESLTIMRRLAAADPGNAAGWHNISLGLRKLGDLRLGVADPPGARPAYEESLTIIQKLAATDPGNALWQNDLAAGLNRLGVVRRASGDLSGALAAYEESLTVGRKLAAADPGNADWQRDLSVGLSNVGDVRLAAGNRAEALTVYEESLTIMRKLTAADPGNANWQSDLVLGLNKVSTAADPPRARAALLEAVAIAEALGRDNRLTAAQQSWPQQLRDALAKLLPETAEAQ